MQNKINQMIERVGSASKAARLLERETGYKMPASTLIRMAAGTGKPGLMALTAYALENAINNEPPMIEGYYIDGLTIDYDHPAGVVCVHFQINGVAYEYREKVSQNRLETVETLHPYDTTPNAVALDRMLKQTGINAPAFYSQLNAIIERSIAD